VKEFLSQKGITWTEKYVDEDRAAAIEMIRRSGQQGVPVTVIGDEVVVGFDRPRLERIVSAMGASKPSGQAGNGKRKSLGAKVADASRYALPGGTPSVGVYVGGVNPGSPAEAAGLKPGDVITQVGEKPVRSVDELSAAITGASGDTLSLSISRGATTRSVEVRL
jgi:S1-C subfamily serine protease